jgi:AAA domain
MNEKLEELIERVLTEAAAAGCDLRPSGSERWRGTCPSCSQDDLTLSVSSDRDRLWLSCWRGRDPELRNPDPASARPVRWAWEKRIPIGKVSLVVGNEGVGKGTVTAWLSGKLSRGKPAGDLFGKPSNVLVIGDEDVLDDTWTPRLHVAGTDMRRVFFQHVGDADVDFMDPLDIE